MAATRPGMFSTIRILFLTAFVLVGLSGVAQAGAITLNFSGNVDVPAFGGNKAFSGFVTIDSAQAANSLDPGIAEYDAQAYQLTFNGLDRHLGAGLFVLNDADIFHDGHPVDGLLLGAIIANHITVSGVTGDALLIMALTGPPSTWDTLSLPSDPNFLSLFTPQFAGVSLEVEGGGDDNDVDLGRGTFAITATPVPEPATLSLTALGLGVITRARRRRQQRAE